MSNYIVRQGETITDVVLNATGDISFMDEVLTLNSLSDWNPELTIGQVLLIPDVSFDPEIISDLNLYPANNYSVYGLLDLMNTVLLILQGNAIVNTELPAAYPVPDLSTYYIILQGDSITDAILNLSGNLKFWDTFLNENKIADWTPNLSVGQKIKLPTGTLIDQKTTAISAVSEITALSTDVTNYDCTVKKNTTTVGLDYGEMTLANGDTLRLYGTPGQTRFDFMWEILSRGALGLIILIDNQSSDPLTDLDTYLNGFKRLIADTACVVVICRMDTHPDPTIDCFAQR